MLLAITNAQIFDGQQFLQDHTLIINGNKVESMFPTKGYRQSGVQNIDLDNHYLIPAFIDLQVNGGDKLFFTKALNRECLQAISRASRESGAHHFLPTLVTTHQQNILKAIELVREAMQEPDSGVLGMHLEGPWLHPEKKGAHNPRYLRIPDDHELDQILKQGQGVIKLITLAPELFTAAQIRKIRESGMLIAAGHSMAGYTEAKQFFDAGVEMVTHLYNAMSPFQSRSPGLVGATLYHPEAWASIIVDGDHVDYAAVEIAYKLKKGRLILISDATFVGEKPDHFHYEGFDIYLKNGRYVTEKGNLAGATINMLDAVQNCVNHVNIPLEEALRMASLYPAQLMGLGHQLGKIQPGYQADLLILDKTLTLKGRISQGTLQTIHSA